MYNNCAKTLCIHNNCTKTMCIQSVPISIFALCLHFVFGEMIGIGFLTFQNFNTRMYSFLIQYPVSKNSAKELSAAVHSVDKISVYKHVYISKT